MRKPRWGRDLGLFCAAGFVLFFSLQAQSRWLLAQPGLGHVTEDMEIKWGLSGLLAIRSKWISIVGPGNSMYKDTEASESSLFGSQ